ncbi:hypothetical protein ACWDBW_47280 [Streptomyces sp. NPDC001107]
MSLFVPKLDESVIVRGADAEMFHLLDGPAEILSGDDIVTAERGDLVIVPRTSSKCRSDTTITSARAPSGKGAAGLMGVRPTSWA